MSDQTTCTPIGVGSTPDRDRDYIIFFHVSKLPKLAYNTSVVLLRCPFVPEIMQGKAHEVFLHQYSWMMLFS
jgi:hypothetical protein